MASEVTIRRFVRALLEKKGDDKEKIEDQPIQQPEKPLKLSWEFGELMTICSEPRELAVKYASTLKGLGFQPGKGGNDHCWIKASSDRYRYSDKILRAIAQKLVSVGATVEIESGGKSLSVVEEQKRSLRGVFF